MKSLMVMTERLTPTQREALLASLTSRIAQCEALDLVQARVGPKPSCPKCHAEAIIAVADDELGPVRMQNVVPRFSATPGQVRSAGPALGAHNDEVWREHGFTADQIALMRERKVI